MKKFHFKAYGLIHRFSRRLSVIGLNTLLHMHLLYVAEIWQKPAVGEEEW
jgi:hypothetical protein